MSIRETKYIKYIDTTKDYGVKKCMVWLVTTRPIDPVELARQIRALSPLFEEAQVSPTPVGQLSVKIPYTFYGCSKELIDNLRPLVVFFSEYKDLHGQGLSNYWISTYARDITNKFDLLVDRKYSSMNWLRYGAVAQAYIFDDDMRFTERVTPREYKNDLVIITKGTDGGINPKVIVRI